MFKEYILLWKYIGTRYAISYSENKFVLLVFDDYLNNI